MRVATIPTNGRECVERAIEGISHQVDHIIIVEAGTTVERREYTDPKVIVIPDPEAPDLNISRWWNIGIDWAAARAKEEGLDAWDVAVINDDVIVPSTWFCYIADDIRALGCVAGCSGGRGPVPLMHRAPGIVSVLERIQGFAFVIVGESGLRADEEFKWWFGDDMLGQQAATMGGMVMMPGCHVEHLYPGAQTTMDHQPQIGRDRTRFIEKNGFVPW